MTFGSDLRKDLEGIDGRTAVFLWNYDRGRLHGVFRGSSKDVVTEPKGRDDPYLYEVRPCFFLNYLARHGTAFTPPCRWGDQFSFLMV